MSMQQLGAVEILEGMDEAFYAIDREWRFVYINRGAERFWGRQREDLLGRSMLQAFPTFPRSEPYAAHVRAMDSGARLRVETISTVNKLPVELNLQPTPWGLAVYFRDITERRRVENDLRARDAILTLAERTAGIGVWDVDLETNLVRGTPQFFRIMGLPPDTGVTPIQTMRNLRHPEDGERLVQGFVAARDGGDEDYEAEYRIIWPDGAVRWIFGRGKVIRDDTGKAYRYAGVDIDITDRRNAEEAVERLAAIVESSDDAIVGKDLDGTIRAWNAGAMRLFGYEPDEIIGEPVTLLIPEDRLEEETEIIARISRGERISSYETVRQRRDGSLIDVSITVSPIRDGKGRVIGASNVTRDITERKRAETQRNLLLREMRHRVKNLFSLTSGIVSLSARSAASADELAEAIRDRLGALARAHEMTLQTVDHGEHADSRPATLSQLIEAILAPYRDPSKHNRIQIVGPKIEISGRSFANIALLFHELATNAAKYGSLSTTDGAVRVVCRIEDGHVLVRWEENGGPHVTGPPSEQGFGSRLAEATVVGQLGGTISREWRPEGLVLSIDVLAERLLG
jgi:PAS domain S-box-containing protein